MDTVQAQASATDRALLADAPARGPGAAPRCSRTRDCSRAVVLRRHLAVLDVVVATALTALAVQQREDNREMRQLLQTRHEVVMERLLHLFQALLRALWILNHNAGLEPEKRLSFGTLPPDIEEMLKPPPLPRPE